MVKKSDKAQIGGVTYIREDTIKKIIAMNRLSETPLTGSQYYYNQNKISTSKIVLALVMTTYFILFVLGIIAAVAFIYTSPEYAAQTITGLFIYVGGATSVSLSFYSIKAKAENVAKIVNVRTSLNDDSGEEAES